MSFTLIFILNSIIFGTFIGLHTLNIFTKIGRKPLYGFLLGFILHVLGLIISLCISPKNDFKPESSLTKRILLGIGRFILFSMLNQILIIELLPKSDVMITIGPIVYSMITYGFLVLGSTWIFRGNKNFIKLG